MREKTPHKEVVISASAWRHCLVIQYSLKSALVAQKYAIN